MKVTLRTKPITGNRLSLYLDFYPPIKHPDTGKSTRREFLNLHLFVKPKTSVDKNYNKETLDLAETIRAKRQIDIHNNRFGFLEAKKFEADFIQFFRTECDKREGKNRTNWLSALGYLQTFIKSIRFKDLNETICNDFRGFLLNSKKKDGKRIAQNTAELYYSKFTATLKKAAGLGLLEKNISDKIEKIKKTETEKNFLSLEELNKLAHTECAIALLKNAALFSALTGLRFADINKLLWSEVHHSTLNGYYIQFRQKKTKGFEVMPISQQAFSLLGERQQQEQRVFEGLYYSTYTSFILKQWLVNAGITKHITFHCFRHTYATLQLTMGTDIYTVSKMLGHKNLKTTEIYGKVIDRRKVEAAAKIPNLIFSDLPPYSSQN